MKKNLRVKVGENCVGNWWWHGIHEGRKRLLRSENMYTRKGNAIKSAKAMAKRIGIPYDPEIIKMHGC